MISNDTFKISRERMVTQQLIPRGIYDEKVINAMKKAPRHLFVDEALYDQAYGDFPLPIGWGQTISQPYIVALMTQELELKGDEKVLEIGTGSGYQAAVLAEIVKKVYSVERISALIPRAKKILSEIGYNNVLIRVDDGTFGWEKESPFDAILVTAASPKIPEPLIKQLSDNGGRLLIPVGDKFSQNLIKIKKTDGKIKKETKGGVRFVKLIGEHGWKS
jgi:protein-L-isoaspartate(D-aspartate) O-methyltransferase